MIYEKTQELHVSLFKRSEGGQLVFFPNPISWNQRGENVNMSSLSHIFPLERGSTKDDRKEYIFMHCL